MTDQYGREILTEQIKGGGMRYTAADGSVCTATKPADPVAALAIFNANPPAKFQTVAQQGSPDGDDLLTKIESLSESQRKRLKAALLNLQK